MDNLQRLQYDEACYLCPGYKHSAETINPDYQKPFAFVNDFASLLDDPPDGTYNEQDLLLAESQKMY